MGEEGSADFLGTSILAQFLAMPSCVPSAMGVEDLPVCFVESGLECTILFFSPVEEKITEGSVRKATVCHIYLLTVTLKKK